MTLLDIHVTSVTEGRYAAHFAIKGDTARYHFWVRRRADGSATVEATPQGRITLYKNPPLGLQPRDDGYFATRYLDATIDKNADMIERVRTYIAEHGLVAAKLKADADAKEAALASRRAAEAAAIRAGFAEYGMAYAVEKLNDAEVLDLYSRINRRLSEAGA